MENGTVLITGAIGSLAIASIEYLTNYPAWIYRCPERPHRRGELQYTDIDQSEITRGKLPPLAAIICNAFTWSISTGLKFTSDHYETSVAINHLAHLALVLRSLGSFPPEGCKIFILGSDAHYPSKNGLEKFPPNLPDDLELLVHPAPDNSGEEIGRPIGPGGLIDLKCVNSDVPSAWRIMMKGVLGPLQPVLKYLIPTLRNTKVAAGDPIETAIGQHRGSSDYFLMSNPEKSSPETQDEEKQLRLWKKIVE